jgi:nitrogen regulatory protein P-II 1
MHMVMFVLDDPAQLDEVLDAWQDVGVSGATIIDSSGLYRRRAQVLGARYAIGFPRIVERIEQGHYTLFVIVRDQDEAHRCLTAVESIVGDLGQPHTGVFATWALEMAKGALTGVPEEWEPDA